MEVPKDNASDSEEENKLLESLVDSMFQQPRNVKRRYIEELEKMVHPERINIEEPPVRKTKGRSKKNSTKRDPLAWEYAEKKYLGKSYKGRSSSGLGSSRGRRQSRSKSSRYHRQPKTKPGYLLANAVPLFILEFIDDHKNV